MNIYYSDKHISLATGLRLGILRFDAVLTKTNKALWTAILDYSKSIRKNIPLDQVNKQEVTAQTRNGYKKCGKDPNRYRPSADSLIRRIVKGNELYQVNNIVDILNFLSLKSCYSIGGYNLKAIHGDIVVDIGQSDDTYSGIGRGELNIEGLPVLRDNEGVFGNPTSDSERTMIKEDAKSFLFCFFDFGENQKLETAIQECQDILEQFANGENFGYEIIAQP